MFVVELLSKQTRPALFLCSKRDISRLSAERSVDNPNNDQDGFTTELHLAGSDGAMFHVACRGEGLLVNGFYKI